jgi:spermidine synthase
MTNALKTEDYFSENLVPAHRQQLQCTEVLFRANADTQEVVIFRNPRFGTVLALDQVIQTTEKDEFIYHEMMTHVPILAHGAAKRVLIIGGGDGGILRHVLMHKNVERAVMVEIEPAVVEMAKRYLPTICGDAFDNARGQVIIADGCAYVRETKDKFDVIIVDSTDNHGPGAVLFTTKFYADCKNRLTPGGVIVTQSGVPFTQPETIQLCHKNLGKSFADVTFYMATIPTYISGAMALGFASDNPALKQADQAALEARFKASGLKDLQYYTPAVHRAAFAVPRYVEKLLGR